MSRHSLPTPRTVLHVATPTFYRTCGRVLLYGIIGLALFACASSKPTKNRYTKRGEPKWAVYPLAHHLFI